MRDGAASGVARWGSFGQIAMLKGPTLGIGGIGGLCFCGLDHKFNIKQN